MSPLLLAEATALDAWVVAIYLALAFAGGMVGGRLLQRKGRAAGDGEPTSEDEYYLAGRRVPGWMNGVSYAVTAMNADVAPNYVGYAAVVGLPIAFFYLPRFALAWMIAATLFAVRWRQLGVRTGPEFYARRFDPRHATVVRVYSALFAVAVNMAPWIGAGMLGVHKIFAPTFGPLFDIDTLAASAGVEPKVITLSIILPLLLLYVWVSGFAGVLITDVLQTLIILMASIAILVMVLIDFGGPAGLAEGVRQALPDRAGEALSTWPVWGHRALGPMLALAWLIVPTVGRGGSVDLEGQRLFSCRTDRDAARMNVWAAAALFLMLLLVTLPALGVIAKHPEVYDGTAAEREEAYSLLLGDYLPNGLLGVALAALLASVMSTIDSHLNYGAQTLVNDMLRPLFPRAKVLDPGSKSAVWIGRLLMLGILAVSIAVTYAADSLIGIALTLAGMYAGAATLFWGQWWWWRVNFPAWLAALVGGPIIYVALGGLALGKVKLPGLLDLWPWWAQQAEASDAAAGGLAMLQALLGMLLTFAVWVTVALVTKPEPMDQLKRFYRDARPPGAWGPVRAACLADGDDPARLPPHGLLAGGLAVATLGAIWLSAATVGLGVLCVGRWVEAAVLLVIGAAGAGAFAKAFNWHLGRMDATGAGE
ncbi:MAG: sodium:solute symporter [Planctomycetota bacterium]